MLADNGGHLLRIYLNAVDFDDKAEIRDFLGIEAIFININVEPYLAQAFEHFSNVFLIFL